MWKRARKVKKLQIGPKRSGCREYVCGYLKVFGAEMWQLGCDSGRLGREWRGPMMAFQSPERPLRFPEGKQKGGSPGNSTTSICLSSLLSHSLSKVSSSPHTLISTAAVCARSDDLYVCVCVRTSSRSSRKHVPYI